MDALEIRKKYQIHQVFAAILFFCLALISACQNTKNKFSQTREITWAEIDTFFTPPPTFAGDFGSFRTPLEFYNGETVLSESQWPARRKEILEKWHGMMGKWPEFLSGQELEIIRSEERESFTQHTVRFKWLPDEETEGYLLIPRLQDTPMPAVITVFYEPETAIGVGGKPMSA